MAAPRLFMIVMICLAIAVVAQDEVEHLFSEIQHSLSFLSRDYVNKVYNEYRSEKAAHGPLRECVFYTDHAVVDASLAFTAYEDVSSRNQTLVFLASCLNYLERCETYLRNSRDRVSDHAGDAFDDILDYINRPYVRIQHAFDIVCNMTRAAAAA